MKKILIAYADESMEYSLRLLGLQAKLLHVFEKIILYRPKDLPENIKNHPLMKDKKGGGYWIWKPYIIWNTLQKYDNSYVCYLDAGCTVNSGKEWDYYFQQLDKYDTLLFQYDDIVSNWEYFGQTSSKIKYWTKKNTLLFFDKYLNDTQYRECNKVMGGIVFCKGKNNDFIKEWLKITLENPELIKDPDKNELSDQYPFFTGFHRHDQSIITPIAYSLFKKDKIIILHERFDKYTQIENNIKDGVINAIRLKVRKEDYKKYIIKYYIYSFFGNKLYNVLLHFYKLLK